MLLGKRLHIQWFLSNVLLQSNNLKGYQTVSLTTLFHLKGYQTVSLQPVQAMSGDADSIMQRDFLPFARLMCFVCFVCFVFDFQILALLSHRSTLCTGHCSSNCSGDSCDVNMFRRCQHVCYQATFTVCEQQYVYCQAMFAVCEQIICFVCAAVFDQVAAVSEVRVGF